MKYSKCKKCKKLILFVSMNETDFGEGTVVVAYFLAKKKEFSWSVLQTKWDFNWLLTKTRRRTSKQTKSQSY
jgi:hypothetical protein